MMMLDGVQQRGGRPYDDAESSIPAQEAPVDSSASMFDGRALDESADGIAGSMGGWASGAPASSAWMATVLAAAASLMAARLMDADDAPLESLLKEVASSPPVEPVGGPDVPEVIEVREDGLPTPDAWGDRPAMPELNLSDDCGSGPEGVTAWQASAATAISDESAPLRARWGGVRDGDREGVTSSADDAAPAVVQTAFVVDVGGSAATFSPAPTPPPDLSVPSPSRVTPAPAVTPPRPLTFDAPPAPSPGTATRTETPVDAAWLQAREHALIAVRQDFTAARDRALASAAAGPSAADRAWSASVGMDADGRFITASDVPLFHWVDSEAPALVIYGDAEGLGSIQQPRTREAVAEGERAVTQTLVATRLRDEERSATEWLSDGQATPVMESKFDPDVVTAWYENSAVVEAAPSRVVALTAAVVPVYAFDEINGSVETTDAAPQATFDNSGWDANVAPSAPVVSEEAVAPLAVEMNADALGNALGSALTPASTSGNEQGVMAFRLAPGQTYTDNADGTVTLTNVTNYGSAAVTGSARALGLTPDTSPAYQRIVNGRNGHFFDSTPFNVFLGQGRLGFGDSMATSGGRQAGTPATQGTGPWSDPDYRNGSDIESDNAAAGPVTAPTPVATHPVAPLLGPLASQPTDAGDAPTSGARTYPVDGPGSLAAPPLDRETFNDGRLAELVHHDASGHVTAEYRSSEPGRYTLTLGDDQALVRATDGSVRLMNAADAASLGLTVIAGPNDYLVGSAQSLAVLPAGTSPQVSAAASVMTLSIGQRAAMVAYGEAQAAARAATSLAVDEAGIAARANASTLLEGATWVLERAFIGSTLLLTVGNVGQDSQFDVVATDLRLVTRPGERLGSIERRVSDDQGNSYWMRLSGEFDRLQAQQLADVMSRTVALTPVEIQRALAPLTTPVPPPVGPTLTINPLPGDGSRKLLDEPLTTPSKVLAPPTPLVTPGDPMITIDDLVMDRDSRVLGQNLTASGRPKPGDGYQPHHIIPTSDPRASQLQQLLQRFDIETNSEINGVWLPQNSSVTNSGETPHNETMRDSYFRYLNRTFSGIDNRADFESALAVVRDDLISGNGYFPLK